MGFGLEEGEARRYRAGARLDMGGAASPSKPNDRSPSPNNDVKLDFNMRW